MKTILLTVSPSEAVGLLNGTVSTLIRKCKVPLGTAYIGVKKARTIKEWLVRCLDDVWRTIGTAYGWSFSANTLHFDGLVVAKCEIKKVEGLEWDNTPDYFGEVDGDPLFDLKDICKKAGITDDDLIEYSGDGCVTLFAIHLSPLSVLDKPMELSDFQSVAFLNRPFDLSQLHDGEMIGFSEWRRRARLTKLPSRWQAVEVGE